VAFLNTGKVLGCMTSACQNPVLYEVAGHLSNVFLRGIFNSVVDPVSRANKQRCMTRPDVLAGDWFLLVWRAKEPEVKSASFNWMQNWRTDMPKFKGIISDDAEVFNWKRALPVGFPELFVQDSIHVGL